MGLFGLFKKLAPQGATPAAPSTDAASAVPKTAKISHESMQFKEGKPYLALIGQPFDVWGVVDVVGDSKSHVEVKDVSEAIIKRAGLTSFEGLIALDRKLVLAHTKGFHELPREEAFQIINGLGENLMAYAKALKGSIEDTAKDEEMQAWYRREIIRDTKKDYTEMWEEDLNNFRKKELPQAAVDYWERQRDEAQWAADRAEKARLRALAKIQKTPPE